jgi:hypothetical protein
VIGPGKYDELCTAAREEAKAVAVVLIVINGEHGNGFSCQTHDLTLLAKIPDVLEQVAAGIRADWLGRPQ